MGSSTRVLLPILLLFGVIFGVTFISNNTNAPVEEKKVVVTPPKKVDPLQFGITTAEPNPNSSQPALRDMMIDWDVGTTGHFDFWFTNPNAEDVEVYLQGKSCTCAGAQLAVIEPDAFQKFLGLSSVGILGNPLQSLAMLPFASAALARDLKWQEMSLESEADRKKVPASGALPQWGVLRVTFSNAKPTETRRITARLMSTVPGGVALPKELSLVSRAGTSVKLFAPYGGGSSLLDFGVVLPNESVSRDLYIFSFTRSEMNPRIEWSTKEADPLLSFTPPVLLTGPAFDEAVNAINAKVPLGPVRIRSMYKTTLTLSERLNDPASKKIIKRLQMGPLDRTLVVSVEDGSEFNSQRMPVRGSIRGELQIVVNNEERDRIDFGKSVNTITGETRDVEVRSKQIGLDAELLTDLTNPPYLQVEMTPKGEQAGFKTWNLKIRVPPGKLNGSFPSTSAIFLRFKDGSGHRMRIPIMGQAIDGGRQL